VNIYKVECVINVDMQNMILIHFEIVSNLTANYLVNSLPISVLDSNRGRGGSDVRLREGFMENFVIMRLSNFYLEANNLSNQHMYALYK
jgi:hypothetical protein